MYTRGHRSALTRLRNLLGSDHCDVLRGEPGLVF